MQLSTALGVPDVCVRDRASQGNRHPGGFLVVEVPCGDREECSAEQIAKRYTATAAAAAAVASKQVLSLINFFHL